MTIPTPEERVANLEGSFARIATRLDRVEIDVRDLRTETNTRFGQMQRENNAQFDQIQRRFNSRIDQIQRQYTSRVDQVAQGWQAFRAEMPPQFDLTEQHALMEQQWDARERKSERLEYLTLAMFVVLVVLIFVYALT